MRLGAGGAIAVFVVTITLASCGARSSLGVGAGAGGSPVPPAHEDAGDAAGDVSVEAAPPDAPVEDPCATAPVMVVGQAVSGTTCGADNPPGTTCSTMATVFYRFVLPPKSELPLHLSGNLLWGVLCDCPQAANCCVGPGGDTGPQGLDAALANTDPAPRPGVLEISRLDQACGGYTVTLGP
jgi:hypothetical protein